MKDGFIKVSAVTTAVRPADVEYNVEQIIDAMKKETAKKTKIAVFPDLCVTGATCGDLFMQKTLLDAAQSGLVRIAEASADSDTLFFVGLPWQDSGCVYDAVAAVQDGEILAVLSDEMNDCVFRCSTMEDLVIGVDFGDGTLPEATVVIQMVAEPETLGADDMTDEILIADSSRDMTAIIRANAGEGESTTDEVYGGYNVIAELGYILDCSEAFTTGAVTTEIDVQAIALQRMNSGFEFADEGYEVIDFDLEYTDTQLTRYVDPAPFIPEYDEDLDMILNIQAGGLRGRMKAIGCGKLVLGISGGLDSTCAMIVCALACDSMGISRKNIHAITMPCFGTSDRTYKNACRLTELMGCRLTEINIGEAVKVHLKDIGHRLDDKNVAYENAQARERTQVLMDIANDEDALVVGTGDLSELALGWCTYNGDHMSNYAVNASVPKTLMRFLVAHYAEVCGDVELCDVLMDVVDTPVSPELLPTVKGEIAQKTEDKIGPYELHDFFIFNMINNGFGPAKIYRLARYAWGYTYDDETIYKWLDTFIRRFFSSQFKRSCMPDGPATGLVSLSPRGSWEMPSDASRNLWLRKLESVKPKAKKKAAGGKTGAANKTGAGRTAKAAKKAAK